MAAIDKIRAARTALVLDQPFFGALALRLKLVEDPGCGTAWTDGTSLGYDPEFIDGLSHDEVTALVAHEVMHCACGHPWRRDQREKGKWNHATDYAINPIITDAGFRLPEGGLNDPLYHGKGAEWIYDRLPDPPEQPEGGDGEGDGDGQSAPNPLGEVRDAPSGDGEPDSQPVTESDWKAAVQQAAMAAKQRGDLPGGAERFAADAVEPAVDWRSVLRRFVQDVAKADYSWVRPNARFMASGIYMPALRSEEMGPMVIAIDTSGSVDAVLLAHFEAEIRTIADDLKPARVHVMYCDARLNHTDVFERDEPVELHMHGGGGTNFCPVFDAVEELDEPPACVVYLTDLGGRFPTTPPDVPVLWGATSKRQAPFGETVPILT